MTQIEIYETGQRFSLPSSWDEMTPEQIQFVFRTYASCIEKGGSPLEFNARVLCHLLDVRFTRRFALLSRLSPETAERCGENVARLCTESLGFMLDTDPETLKCRITFDSVANPLPSVRSGLRKLHGPGEMLQDLTFGEFRHASVAMQSFFHSGKQSDLDECIAFLYRRGAKKPNRAGRRVVPVDSADISRAIRPVSALKPWQKNLILLWFASCVKSLQTRNVAINGEMVELGRLFASDGEDKGGYGFGWNDLAVQIAKDATIGNLDRVDEEPLFSVLGIMWHNFKEQKRYEAISKTH